MDDTKMTVTETATSRWLGDGETATARWLGDGTRSHRMYGTDATRSYPHTAERSRSHARRVRFLHNKKVHCLFFVFVTIWSTPQRVRGTEINTAQASRVDGKQKSRGSPSLDYLTVLLPKPPSTRKQHKNWFNSEKRPGSTVFTPSTHSRSIMQPTWWLGSGFRKMLIYWRDRIDSVVLVYNTHASTSSRACRC